MKFILDFDHTLMDTDRFVADAKKAGFTFEEIVTPEIWQSFLVRDYLYPDVLPWLESKKRDDLILLTATTPSLGPRAREFQKEKISSVNFQNIFSSIIVMQGSKDVDVAKIYDGTPACFVDDSLSHHIAVQNNTPEVISILIDRPNSSHVEQATHSNIYAAKNLADVDAIIESL